MYRKLATYTMGAVILAGGLFSAANTFALFAGIFGGGLSGIVWSLAGLALFDLGALGWLLFFAHAAKGNAQRAIAAVCGLACLVLTLAAAGTHVLLTQSLITVPTWAGMVAVGSILAALAINIGGAAASHMSDPDTLRDMRAQQLNDERAEAMEQAQSEVWREGLRQARARVAQNAAYVAARLSSEFSADAERELLASTAGGRNTPGLLPPEPEPEAEAPAAALPVYANGTARRAKAAAPKG